MMTTQRSQSCRRCRYSSTSIESDDVEGEEHKLVSRLHRSYSTYKQYYKDLYKEEKKENELLEKELGRLKKMLREHRDRLIELAGGSPYHVSGFQFGDNNTMNVVNTTTIDVAFGEVKSLISKLTRTVDNVVEDKARVELELGQHKMMLRELQETLSRYDEKNDKNIKETKKRFKKDKQCWKELKSMLQNIQSDHQGQQVMSRDIQETLSSYCERYRENTKEEKKRFKELTSMLHNIEVDRPDQEVFSDCIEGLQEYLRDSNGVVSDFQSLPRRIHPGIARLVNKFGMVTWQTFASVLDVNPCTISALSEEQAHAETPLQCDMFTKILAAYVTESKRTVNMFMKRLPRLELERIKEAKRELILAINPRAPSDMPVDLQPVGSSYSEGRHIRNAGISQTTRTDKERFASMKLTLYKISYEQCKANLASLASIPDKIDQKCKNLLEKLDEYLVLRWLYTSHL